MHLRRVIPGLGHLHDASIQQLVTLATYNTESLQGLGGCVQGAGDAERVLRSGHEIQPCADPQPGAQQSAGHPEGTPNFLESCMPALIPIITCAHGSVSQLRRLLPKALSGF